jgi:hypothetical protein
MLPELLFSPHCSRFFRQAACAVRNRSCRIAAGREWE